MALFDLEKLLSENTYPGRGIVIGTSADGKKAMIAYFIMGRSENSRNRVFTVKDGTVFTEPFDPSKVEDPSLIIYAALRRYENKLIVTNGNKVCLIKKNVRSHKHRISEKTAVNIVFMFCRFILELSHSLKFAHICIAI